MNPRCDENDRLRESQDMVNHALRQIREICDRSAPARDKVDTIRVILDNGPMQRLLVRAERPVAAETTEGGHTD